MSQTTTVTSKREALRFPGNDRIITFRTDYEEGEGALLNISNSGCALHRLTVPLEHNEKVLLLLQLDEDQPPTEIMAKVIRQESEITGLHFLNTKDDFRQKLVHFFAKEQRRQESGPDSHS